MFRAHVLNMSSSNLHYTASGTISPVSGVTFHNMGTVVHEKSTYMCEDTRGCILQFSPPDDVHIVL